MHAEIAAFLESSPRWSPTTRELFGHRLEHFAQFLEGQGLDWRHCQAKQLDSFLDDLRWQPIAGGGLYAPNTIYQAQRAILHFYRWSKARRLISIDPTLKWESCWQGHKPKKTIDRSLLLRLLNLPDVGQARGQRDQALLQLMLAGKTISACCKLEVDDVAQLSLEDSAASALERYLKSGRPQLLGSNQSTALLLTSKGRGFITGTGLRMTLKPYQRALGLEFSLTSRLLRNSYLEQVRELHKRRHHPGLELSI